MIDKEQMTELEARFSSEGATAPPWRRGPRGANAWRGRRCTGSALSARTGGRRSRRCWAPGLGAGLDGALYFCTGPEECRAKNLAQDPRCVLTTGCNRLDEGLDLLIEVDATRG